MRNQVIPGGRIILMVTMKFKPVKIELNPRMNTPRVAAITVLLLCLQVKELALGATLVLSFSLGLAVTLVAVGAVAALGLRQATKRFSGLGTFLRRAPYFSGGLILLVGCYMGMHGWLQLTARAAG